MSSTVSEVLFAVVCVHNDVCDSVTLVVTLYLYDASLWNTLPVHLKNRNLTLTTFMRHLKSYLFSQY